MTSDVDSALRDVRDLTDQLRAAEDTAARRRDLVVELRARGVSAARIADAMGVTPAAVTHLVRKHKSAATSINTGNLGR